MASDDPPITFTLPDADEMIKRLQAVDNDPDIVKYFYSDLLQWGAGTTQDPPGVIFLLNSALDAYEHSRYPSLDPAPIVRKMHKFIDALIDDPDAAWSTRLRWDHDRAPRYTACHKPHH